MTRKKISHAVQQPGSDDMLFWTMNRITFLPRGLKQVGVVLLATDTKGRFKPQLKLVQ